MHPVGGHWRLIFPPDFRAKGHVNIPGRLLWSELEHGGIGSGEDAFRVREVSGASVRNAPSFPVRCPFYARPEQHRYPDNISAQVRTWNLLENFFLYFGGPPKADPSMRVNQEQQTNFAEVAVEGPVQRLEIIRKPGDRGIVGVGGAACEGQREKRCKSAKDELAG